MNEYKLFWDTIKKCDWSQKGNDDKVLEPVVRFLFGRDEQYIYRFDDQMSDLLHQLDNNRLARQCREVDPAMSDDSFLYSRCVALINGEEFYEKVRGLKCPEIWEMEFESILYVPQKAWAMKTNSDEEDYPHSPLYENV